jgi:hypothetical protein
MDKKKKVFNAKELAKETKRIIIIEPTSAASGPKHMRIRQGWQGV